jgi:hypothetical protein
VDLRVLLRVTDREATVRDLAESMGQRPTVIRRSSARLARALRKQFCGLLCENSGDREVEVRIDARAGKVTRVTRDD